MIKIRKIKFSQLIKFLLLFFVFAYPLGQLAQLPPAFKNNAEIRINLIDPLIFLITFIWFIWHLFTKKRIFFSREYKSFILFAGVLFFSWVINFKNYYLGESVTGLLYLLRLANYSFIYLIFYDLRHNLDFFTGRIINKILLFWSLALGFIGLGQYLFLPDTRFLLSSGWDDHYFRVIGSFFDPNFTGLILSLAIIWGINNFYSKQSLIKNQFLKLFLLFLILFPAFFLTYSRSSYLALVAGLSVYFVLKAKKRNLFYLLVFFVLVVLLLPRPGGEGVKLERTASIVLRLENWQAMFSLWKKHPFFGVGFNNLRYTIRKTDYLRLEQWRQVHSAAGAENSYLFILVTAGLIGLAGFFFYCFSTVKNIFRFSENQKRLLLSSFTALLIHCFFTNSFFYPWVFLWLMTIQSLED